jgi:SOS-response transcriptional repressor LexA
MVYTLDMKLTKKQKIMLDFIDGFIKGNGYSPTLREIMRALGYKSVSTVAKHVDNLVAAGFLEKQDGEVRSLTLSSEKKEVWWQNLAKEIKKREVEDDEKSRSEVEILKKALEIVRQ